MRRSITVQTAGKDSSWVSGLVVGFDGIMHTGAHGCGV